MFVTLADTLVTGFDVAGFFDDLAGACVELLDVTAAGLMLVDPAGRLRVMASSSERSRLLELLEIQNDEGPCLDCYRGAEPVRADDLVAGDGRWPMFSAEAARVGFGSVYALPMRLRAETIGALNLFHRRPAALTDAGLRLAQGLADVATIGILQQRAIQRGADLADQLQTALNSRLIIEQAKGVLSEREQVDMSAAFDVLRRYARRTGRKLSEVAAAVVAGELSSTELQSVGAPRHQSSQDTA
ncbi:MAG TPA: GAF and ANTAR domain-containing protein [Jatrophihabitans sp.]|nr:GAF and ANTAR domain-containing protein [Jatrophihabitans sp.]